MTDAVLHWLLLRVVFRRHSVSGRVFKKYAAKRWFPRLLMVRHFLLGFVVRCRGWRAESKRIARTQAINRNFCVRLTGHGKKKKKKKEKTALCVVTLNDMHIRASTISSCSAYEQQARKRRTTFERGAGTRFDFDWRPCNVRTPSGDPFTTWRCPRGPNTRWWSGDESHASSASATDAVLKNKRDMYEQHVRALAIRIDYRRCQWRFATHVYHIIYA